MSSSLRDATPEEFVKAVDPSLELVRCFQGSPRSEMVYKVRRDDAIYVLKGILNDSWNFFFQFERDALRETADVQGITHLVTDYGTVAGTHSAFLKEYADGYHFCLSRIPLSSRTLLESQLSDTVRALNKKGYFGLDIADRNLVVSTDSQRITLIDAFHVRKYPPDDTDLRLVNALFHKSS